MEKEEHLSSSKPQKEIEGILIDKLKVQFECEFQNKIEGYSFQPDFFNKEKSIIGEIYCGIDKLNSAQRNKIMADCFKLVSIEKCLDGEWTKFIVVVDEKIKKELEIENTWRKIAMKNAKIDILFVQLDEEDIIKLRKTKISQTEGMKISKVLK